MTAVQSKCTRVLSMKGLILCVLALHVVTAHSAVAGGGLAEFSFTQQQVHGKYVSRDGTRGIIFSSRADDYLLIKTLSGGNIVETDPFSEKDGKKLRPVHIMGRQYHQHAASPSHPDRPVGHDTPLSDALHDLMNVEEIGLLEKAAEAVGRKGLTGKNTPAVLPFFVFALRVTQFQTGGDDIIITNSTTRVQRADCRTECPPCPNNNCFGMCGKGCSCWKWVCGDCCWHVGCYYHDMCCARGFFQTKCLFPVTFRCEQPYSC